MSKKLDSFMADIMYLVAIFAFLMLCHEYTHVLIFQMHGCTDIKPGWDATSMFVSATCPDDSSQLSTDINEIVGYNIMPFLALILFFLSRKDREYGGD